MPRSSYLAVLLLAAARLGADAPATVWSRQPEAPPPVLHDNVVFAPLADGTLLVTGSDSAVRFDDRGDVVSRTRIASVATLSGQTNVDPFGGIVRIGYDGSVSRDDGVGGARYWRLTPTVKAVAVASKADADVVIALADGNLLCVSASTGETLWGPTPSLGDDFTKFHTVVTLLVDPHGDVVVSGFNTTDRVGVSVYVAARLDGMTGQLRWRSAGLEAPPASGRPILAATDARGDLFLAGSIQASASTLKLATEDGSLLWSVSDVPAFVTSLSVSEDGNPILGGDGIVSLDGRTGARLFGPVPGSDVTSDGHGGFYTYRDGVVRLDARTGALLWGPVPGTTLGCVGGDLVLAQGNPLTVSRRERATGRFLWQHVEESAASSGSPGGLHVDADGNILSVGTLGPVKYTPDGTVLWGPTAFPAQFQATRSVLTPSGDVVAWGYGGLASFDGGTGALQWSVPLIGGTDRIVFAANVDAAGNIYVSAVSYVGKPPTAHLSTASYDRAGHLRWIRPDVADPILLFAPGGELLLVSTGGLTFLDPADGHYLQWRSFPLALDPFSATLRDDGTLVVAGVLYPLGGPNQAVLFAMDIRSGALRWGPTAIVGIPRREQLLADSGGDLLLAGSSQAGPYLARYDGANGTLRWSAALLGGDVVTMTRVTGGDLALLGSDASGSRVTRLDATTGNIVWPATSVGSDRAVAMKALGTGVAILSGTDRTSRVDSGLGFAPFELPTASCGTAFDVALPVENVRPPLRLTVISGTVPPGITLDESTGRLAGVPSLEGTYPLRFRATDASGLSADLDLELLVGNGPGKVAIDAAVSGCDVTLTAPGPWTAIRWLPGGESQAALTVTPDSSTVYGVVVTEAGGCTRRASIVVSRPAGCPVTSTVERRWVLPSSARIAGLGDAFFTTDLLLANPTASTITARVKFLGHDVDGRSGPERSVTIGPGATWTGADVLASLFGLESAYGALLVTSIAPLAGSSTTATPGLGGRFGQSVPLVDEASWITPAAPRSVVGVTEDGTTRTNLVLANPTDAVVDVTVTLVGADGTVLASGRFPLRQLGMTQVTRVVRALGFAQAVRNARLVLTTTTPGGAFAAYAAAIDEGTNDPRTLLPR